MATSIQKGVLRYMQQSGGCAFFVTGFKLTRDPATHKPTGLPVVGCSVNVLDGLKANKWIELREQGEHRNYYRLTDTASAIVGSN